MGVHSPLTVRSLPLLGEGSVSQDKQFMCRRCRVAAHVHIINGEIDRISCPSCEVSLEGEAARNAPAEQALHYAAKEFSDMLGRTFRKGGTVEYRPGLLKDPGGPFVLSA